MILEPVDVRFELLWRAGAIDRPIVTFEHHFDPPTGGAFDAVPYEETRAAAAVPAASGDQLILRLSAPSATRANAYIPNGDGESHGGRIPFIVLPR